MKSYDKANPTILDSSATNDPVTIPFFTIGVTTYNRPELLKQTLASITQQSFSDFEVIVGNDYVQEPLSAERLGINDPRIRFVNHSQNLGEIENNNVLIKLARGRYFTWQTDDDLYTPNFLEEVYEAIARFKSPLCVFTGFEYIRGPLWPDGLKSYPGNATSYSGREFLRMYWDGMWDGSIKALGCTGVYDRTYLKQLGGVKALSDTPFALYSEHLLLFKMGLLEQLAYIDEPLVKFRVHDGSWGKSPSKNPELCKQAGEKLIRECLPIFCGPGLRDDFQHNIRSVMKYIVTDTLGKLETQDRKRFVSPLEILPYLFSLRKQFDSLMGSVFYWKALYGLGWVGVHLILKRLKQLYLTQMVYPSIVRLLRIAQLTLGRNS